VKSSAARIASAFCLPGRRVGCASAAISKGISSGMLQTRNSLMNRIFHMLIAGTLLTIGSSAIGLAADAVDPVVGTWTLNLAKSKFDPGPAWKSQTRTYAQTADGIALSYSGVAADGSAVSGRSTFRYDGKDYAMTGSTDFDAVTLKRINARTVKTQQKKDGKVVGSTLRTISGHGKVLTLDNKGKDAKGASFHNVLVFDRQ
jgi:hypothetical protein